MTEQTTTPPRRPRPQVMTLTPRAAERVRAIMTSKGPEVAGLKIGVKKGGCAGMEYTLEHAETVNPLDEVVEQDGARVMIAPMAQMFLFGTQIDFVNSLLETGFRFNNPNVVEACGCGESIKFDETLRPDSPRPGA